MMIKVKYLDDSFDMVRPEILDRLLDAGKIGEFQRRDGWVAPGTGKLRSRAKGTYSGPERRMRRMGERRISVQSHP